MGIPKNTGLKSEHQNRKCVHCNLPLDKAKSRLSTNRSKGFGLIGLAHPECHEENNGNKT